MSNVIKLVQSDDLPGISFTIRDANTAADGAILDKKDPLTWRPVDLTGATVSAAISEAGVNKQVDTAFVAVVDAPAGEVVLHLNDCTFLDVPGQYDCEVTVDFQIGQQTVYDMLTLDVRERVNAPSSN